MTGILLRTGSLSFAYPERAGLFRRKALRDVVKRVDLAVPRGSVLGLVGESGSGKTTLGRLLVRLLRPTSGGIQFDGIEIGGLAEAAMRPLRARIQMIFQDPQSPFATGRDADPPAASAWTLAATPGSARPRGFLARSRRFAGRPD